MIPRVHLPTPRRFGRVVVTIPVNNEAERIEACLSGLQAQTRRPDAVLLLLNNCTDSTEAVVRQMAGRLTFPLQIVVQALPPSMANAGYARRLAMELAADLAGRSGILLTTDADAVVARDWIAHNLDALGAGADVVCGRAVIDPAEARLIPEHLHDDDALECRLIALLDHLAWVLDPESHDPPPRHTEASGASIGVWVSAYRRAGGMPAVPSGEDRAFVRTLWCLDARVRHDPDIAVVVSGRTEGRAPGGMADAIRRRMVQQDIFADDQAEPADDAFQRYTLRHRVRLAWSGATDATLAETLGLPPARLRRILSARSFGAAWATVEAVVPMLHRRRVRFTSLPQEIASAEDLLRRLAEPEIMAAD